MSTRDRSQALAFEIGAVEAVGTALADSLPTQGIRNVLRGNGDSSNPYERNFECTGSLEDTGLAAFISSIIPEMGKHIYDEATRIHEVRNTYAQVDRLIYVDASIMENFRQNQAHLGDGAPFQATKGATFAAGSSLATTTSYTRSHLKRQRRVSQADETRHAAMDDRTNDGAVKATTAGSSGASPPGSPHKAELDGQGDSYAVIEATYVVGQDEVYIQDLVKEKVLQLTRIAGWLAVRSKLTRVLTDPEFPFSLHEDKWHWKQHPPEAKPQSGGNSTETDAAEQSLPLCHGAECQKTTPLVESVDIVKREIVKRLTSARGTAASTTGLLDYSGSVQLVVLAVPMALKTSVHAALSQELEERCISSLGIKRLHELGRVAVFGVEDADWQSSGVYSGKSLTTGALPHAQHHSSGAQGGGSLHTNDTSERAKADARKRQCLKRELGLARSVSEVLTDHRSEHIAAIDALRSIVAGQEERITDLFERLMNSEARSAALNADTTALRALQTKSEAERAALAAEREAERAALKTLQTEGEAKTAALKALEAERAALKALQTEREAEREAKTAALKALQAEREAKTAALKALQAEREAKTVALKALQAEREAKTALLAAVVAIVLLTILAVLFILPLGIIDGPIDSEM